MRLKAILWPFKPQTVCIECDVTKGIKAAQSAGHSVERYAIEKATGNLVFYLAGGNSAASQAPSEQAADGNEWDNVQS